MRSIINTRIMKKSKFTEAQIVFALRQAETGTKVAEVCRKMGISEAAFYNWKKKYGGLGTSELRRLKQLEAENQQLKKLVADLSLDMHMLSAVERRAVTYSKKAVRPARRRELAQHLVDEYRVSTRRACRVVCLARSTYRYTPQPDRPSALGPDPRDRSDARSLWLLAHLRTAQTRGLAGQPQACLSPLQARRTQSAQQAAPSQSGSGPSLRSS
ncbi:MAG: hypothetical protein RhofKO_08520 [Rhodothermales bacterium]